MAGTVLLLVVTRRGPYVSPDSIAYVGTARSLLAGDGLAPPPGAPPAGNFAPLYTVVLAAAGWLTGADPLTVARAAGPLAFGGTIAMSGLLAWRLAGSLPLAVAAQVLVLVAGDALFLHSAALSEPLFLLLCLATLAAAWPCVVRPRPGLLVAAGGLAGAACLTRYVGVALVAAVAVVLVVAAGRRWRDAGLFAAVALAPLAGWLAWLQAAHGRAGNRSAVLHLPDGAWIVRGLRSAGAWVVPRALWPLGAALVVAVVALAARAAWSSLRSGRTAGGPTAAGDGRVRALGASLVLAFGALYLAALAGDRALFDVTGRLDTRFMLVPHVLGVLAAVWLVGRAGEGGGGRLAALALAAVVAVQVVRGGLWLSEALPRSTARLGGFAAPAWAGSEVVGLVRALPPRAPVWSNQPEAVWFLTGRTALPVPERRALLTGRPNPDYEAEVSVMAAGLDGGGVLVWFTEAPARRVFLPDPGALAARLGLAETARDGVGVAYRPDP